MLTMNKNKFVIAQLTKLDQIWLDLKQPTYANIMHFYNGRKPHKVAIQE